MATAVVIHPANENEVVPSTLSPAAHKDKEPASAGLWNAFSAILLILLAIENLSDGALAPLANSLSEKNLEYGDLWLKLINDKNLAKIKQDLKIKNANERSAAISADSAELNINETLYNQSSTYWKGLGDQTVQGVNDKNSDYETALQEFQQGLLTVFANLYPA